jgi:phage baseplate assembly protein W|tara:strand:- start:2201 stop:2692 length:492 start_codon:yes stop_codon:yes gene_type:complete
MAVRDTSKKPYLQDEDDKIKIGLDLPIRRDSELDGFFASTSTTIEAVKNNIRNLLQTNEGERLFQPNLGLNLRGLLFEHIKSENLIAVEDAILDRFELWLPFVQVRDIKIDTIESNQVVGANEIRVKILFNITQDPNTLDSVTLNFSDGSTINSESSVGGGGY